MRGCWPFRRKTRRVGEWLAGDGKFKLQVSGESFYPEAFKAICGKRTEDGVDMTVGATLILEDKNRYDPHAVRVEIGGHQVGYVSRETAPAVRKLMKSERAECMARIRGGWSRKKGKDLGDYGVRLDVKLG